MYDVPSETRMKINKLSKLYSIDIEQNKFHYYVGNHILLSHPGAANIGALAAYLTYRDGRNKIIFNNRENCTEKELITVLLHEIGHHLDSKINTDFYNGVIQITATNKAETEVRAWEFAIAEADKLGIELCYRTAKIGLDSYNTELDIINSRLAKQNGE